MLAMASSTAGMPRPWGVQSRSCCSVPFPWHRMRPLPTPDPTMKLKRHVVVIGGGFGGLSAVRALAREPVRVTLLDRSNHHLFQPLLYQVAMAGLSPGEIAVPIRAVLSRQANARVLLAEVTHVDLEQKRVETREVPPLDYDYLVVATGAEN